MNYSKIGWTQKTAITQSDLTHMDEGIYELAAESSETKSKVEQLRFSNIQAGVYFFGSDTTAEEENRNGVLQKKITFPTNSRRLRIIFNASSDLREKSVGTNTVCKRFSCSSWGSALLMSRGTVATRAKSKVVLPIKARLKKPLRWEATKTKSASYSSASPWTVSLISPVRVTIAISS